MNKTAAVLAVLCVLAAAARAEDPGDRQRQRDPIVITSDTMKAAELSRQVEFTGNVTLKKEEMTLYADTAVVFYGERSKSIREIEATGNVVVRKEGSIAHANRAHYYSSDEKIVLTGDARILENENEIGGDRITLFLRNERSIVEGGKVLLYQDAGKGPKRQEPQTERSPEADDVPFDRAKERQ